MADSCRMKFSCIRKKSLQVQDIWKDGEFSNWLLSLLHPQSFQLLVFKALKNRKPIGYVDRQHVRSIDRNLFFCKLKLFIFTRWWQQWMNWTTIKRRCSLKFYFVVFRWFVLILKSMSIKWFTIDVHVSLSLKLRLRKCMHTNNCIFVFMFRSVIL